MQDLADYMNIICNCIFIHLQVKVNVAISEVLRSASLMIQDHWDVTQGHRASDVHVMCSSSVSPAIQCQTPEHLNLQVSLPHHLN